MGELIGYARCSTVLQDLTAQRQALAALGVPDDRIYLDKGLTGTSRARPDLDQALAAVRSGDTLAVPKLDRLARSVLDARHIGDSLVARGIKLSLGGTIYDPADPLGKMFFNILGLPPYMGCGQGKPERHPRSLGVKPERKIEGGLPVAPCGGLVIEGAGLQASCRMPTRRLASLRSASLCSSPLARCSS
jgi:hypothetical protein